ncbi:MAG: hypothetical protein QOJ46_1630 [bacterium]|jgi:hypothetical protein
MIDAMPAMATSAPDDDVREVLRGPSPADARESLVYWRVRLDGLPRRQRAARREARAMVIAWEERVRSAEIERWGGGWMGRAAGGAAVLRSLGFAAAARRIVRFVLPGKLVVGVLAVVLGTTLLCGVLLGALLAALL